ncbi:MAG: 2-hydroxyacid dehydrogenase [Candidatus Methylomirabilaceae bacterium]
MPDSPVLILDPELAEAAGRNFPELEVIPSQDSETLPAAAARAVAIVTQSARVDMQLLAQARALRLLIKMGRVYDNVDLDSVRTRGVPFGLVPRKGPGCVAELALTLILALSKDLIAAHRDVGQGAYRRLGVQPAKTSQRVIAFRWMQPARLHEVRGKTLGCVGFGEIGCELSLRAQPLGMRVIYTRRRPLPARLEESYAVTYRPLLTLMEESDYVCVAAPHTEDTHHLIGAEHLRRLGPAGYLVNVARGGVVDEEALIDALRSGTIAGAGLDVFTYEPLPADSPLCTLENVILTPHIGGGTGTSREGELTETLREVTRVLNGGTLRHPIV